MHSKTVFKKAATSKVQKLSIQKLTSKTMQNRNEMKLRVTLMPTYKTCCMTKHALKTKDENSYN